MTAEEMRMEASRRPTADPENSLSPKPILEALYGFTISRVLSTAVELEVFTLVAAGVNTLNALQQDTGCSRTGLSRLLHALGAK